jgi:hypothetical protein
MNLSWKKLRHLTDTYGDYFYILDLEQFNRNYQNFLGYRSALRIGEFPCRPILLTKNHHFAIAPFT